MKLIKCLLTIFIVFIILSNYPLASVSASPIYRNSSPNKNINYYGYLWLDGREREDFKISVEKAFAALSSTGKNRTNMNIVHTIKNLNSAACENSTCSLGIGAGHFPSDTFLDICPSAKDNSECLAQNSWKNIWNIVEQIKSAKNLPIGIYFIDEPSWSNGLRDSNGKYVKWRYSSYLCTLREALSANNLSYIKIFTILGLDELGSDEASNNITKEIRHQMPKEGCKSRLKSTPDWIGIDYYDWKHIVGGQDDSRLIHATYNQYFPKGETMPKWVLVPPAASDVDPKKIFNDVDLHDRIQVYWDYLNQFPDDPVVAITNFRFDPQVMKVPINVDPNDHNNHDNRYWRSRELLKFMGNRLTP